MSKNTSEDKKPFSIQKFIGRDKTNVNTDPAEWIKHEAKTYFPSGTSAPMATAFDALKDLLDSAPYPPAHVTVQKRRVDATEAYVCKFIQRLMNDGKYDTRKATVETFITQIICNCDLHTMDVVFDDFSENLKIYCSADVPSAKFREFLAGFKPLLFAVFVFALRAASRKADKESLEAAKQADKESAGPERRSKRGRY
jgi:hypothetical protein